MRKRGCDTILKKGVLYEPVAKTIPHAKKGTTKVRGAQRSCAFVIPFGHRLDTRSRQINDGGQFLPLVSFG